MRTLLPALALFLLPAGTVQDRRPNLLWIIGEDVGPELECYGHLVYQLKKRWGDVPGPDVIFPPQLCPPCVRFGEKTDHHLLCSDGIYVRFGPEFATMIEEDLLRLPRVSFDEIIVEPRPPPDTSREVLIRAHEVSRSDEFFQLHCTCPDPSHKDKP